MTVARFKAKLFRYPGPGGWTFAKVPDKYAPPVTQGWGRTPVHAQVDGRGWETSVWRDKKHGTLLPVPKAIRCAKGDGDVVTVAIRPPVSPSPASGRGGARNPRRSSRRS